MNEIKISYAEIVEDYFDSNLDIWVKIFRFNLGNNEIKYEMAIISSNNKEWELDNEGFNVRFAPPLSLNSIAEEILSLGKGDSKKINELYQLLDTLGDIRENHEFLIPKLLEMTKEDNKVK
ncbi:hypothetical protein SAMN05880501_101137 [Ureibacillus xyleni]|uniref:Uncharacterized protein n=1 Tax=Ureibacillus xyleni TaxID=614648 RepID=A0A285RD19_9BACL|nr:hypothetical protein [Ureibacillus xyleni]SOB90302.1 hypothetical protein SAMN05880501_101137 [Ureibacillus xyleni]